jgi:hypothetical protein
MVPVLAKGTTRTGDRRRIYTFFEAQQRRLASLLAGVLADCPTIPLTASAYYSRQTLT